MLVAARLRAPQALPRCLPLAHPYASLSPPSPSKTTPQPQIAVKACQEGAGSLQVIHFSLFEAKAMHAWTAAARAAGLTEEEAAEEPAAAAEAAEEESSGGSRASEKEEL